MKSYYKKYDFSHQSEDIDVMRSSVRWIEHEGRQGVNLPELYGALRLPEHTLRHSSGSLAVWLMFTDDLRGRINEPIHKKNNPFSDKYVIMTDRPFMGDPATAHFSLYYATGGGPQLIAKWYAGQWHEGLISERPDAIAWAEYWAVERLEWYHMVVTWDHGNSLYEIFMNGVHLGTYDHSMDGPRKHARPGEALYIGNPAIVYSGVEFYDYSLNKEDAQSLFLEGGGNQKSETTSAITSQTEGQTLKRFDFSPNDEWELQLDLGLKDPDDMGAFVVQGNLGVTQSTPDGLEIKTPGWDENFRTKPGGERALQIQFYLWTKQVFEGDLYVKFEFQTKNRHGLALLMTQAAGMLGEDFMLCHQPRTTGSMDTVVCEDVRNYHWEFYREMYDTRCDRASHYMCKNPWHWLADYQLEDRVWEQDRWYTLEYLQVGSRIKGAIDGTVVLDFEDNPAINLGPVLLSGHLSIRCMIRSHLLFRNLKIFNKGHFKVF